MEAKLDEFDLFLSHSHRDAPWVEDLARRLEDEEGFRVWLDKWILVPGAPWQPELARGLDQAHACAVCLGSRTPRGWFKNEIERATNRQANDPSFRVIPVLLPEADRDVMPEFLDLKTWVDFGAGEDSGYAFHLLVSGARGVPPGRWPPGGGQEAPVDPIGEKLRQLQQWKDMLEPQVVIEAQQKLLDTWMRQ